MMLRSGLHPASVFRLGGGWQYRCLVLSASQFQHILNDPAQTSLLSGKRRGMILQELCKKELARLHPHSTIEEPMPGTCWNGARRSANNALCDFVLDNRKIECKSAQMSWSKRRTGWLVRFRHVKLPSGYRYQAPFDDLYLTLFSPDSLYIIKHDLQTGVTAVGKQTGSDGHDIVVYGASGQECWQSARSQILDKILAPGRCKLVAQIDLSGVEVRSWLRKQMEELRAPQDYVYQNVPLSHMTTRKRGLCIEEIAFKLDQILNPNCSFSRNSSESEVDWVRSGVRVECKSAQMCQNKQRGSWCWRCCFRNIKSASSGVRDLDLFDELWLAIYSPRGIHVFKHPGGQVRFSLTGLKEQHSGQDIHVYSSKNVLNVREALDEMLHKMEAWGCQPLATILW